MDRYKIPEPGNGYIPEIRKKCYWEIIIKGNRVLLIQKGGPLEPVALEITASVMPTGFEDPEWEAELEVTDCWEWGE